MELATQVCWVVFSIVGLSCARVLAPVLPLPLRTRWRVLAKVLHKWPSEATTHLCTLAGSRWERGATPPALRKGGVGGGIGGAMRLLRTSPLGLRQAGYRPAAFALASRLGVCGHSRLASDL